VSAPLEYGDFLNDFMVNHRYFEKKNKLRTLRFCDDDVESPIWKLSLLGE
jgi:hypothetical protein